MGFFIGVDSGTQSTKAVVVDGETGQVMGKASQAYGLIENLPPGHMEQHPEVWARTMLAVIRKSIEQSGVDRSKVKAIGVSGQQHGFVPLDDMGTVIRPAKLWNDTSTAEECAILTEALGELDEITKLSGLPFLPGYTAPKILWLKRHEPENYARLAHVLLPHDYLNYMLTGNVAMEYGDASGTCLMDVRKRQWSKVAIDALDPELESKLPDLMPSDTLVGNLSKKAAHGLHLSTDVVVSAGGGDNMMGAIGTGNTSPGKVTVSLGTSGTVYAYSDKPVVDPRGEIAAFCDSTNGWLPLVCTMNVTVASEQVRNLFEMSHEELEKTINEIEAGSGGVMFLPYLTGERTPSMPDSNGVYYGLTPRNFNKGNLTRAAVEGATLGLNYGLERMRELGIEPTEIRLTGGGSKNPAWRQLCADVFNAEVVTLVESEGAAYGAALQALWAYKRSQREDESITSIVERLVEVDESSRVKPIKTNVEKYKELQSLHDQLRDRLFR
jgi:xylulokinase